MKKTICTFTVFVAIAAGLAAAVWLVAKFTIAAAFTGMAASVILLFVVLWAASADICDYLRSRRRKERS